ncbi:MAG: hypothetical protein QME77_13095, partial [bacterium]|nr:hypothetical protein [bacterium]
HVTYAGELGWEMYVAPEHALRLEKVYRYWSADITPEYTPCESGQGFCVKLDKGEFQGQGTGAAER